MDIGDEKKFKTSQCVGVFGKDPTGLSDHLGRILVADYPLPPTVGPGWTISWQEQDGNLRVWLIDLNPNSIN